MCVFWLGERVSDRSELDGYNAEKYELEEGPCMLLVP